MSTPPHEPLSKVLSTDPARTAAGPLQRAEDDIATQTSRSQP